MVMQGQKKNLNSRRFQNSFFTQRTNINSNQKSPESVYFPQLKVSSKRDLADELR